MQICDPMTLNLLHAFFDYFCFQRQEWSGMETVGNFFSPEQATISLNYLMSTYKHLSALLVCALCFLRRQLPFASQRGCRNLNPIMQASVKNTVRMENTRCLHACKTPYPKSNALSNASESINCGESGLGETWRISLSSCLRIFPFHTSARSPGSFGSKNFVFCLVLV